MITDHCHAALLVENGLRSQQAIDSEIKSAKEILRIRYDELKLQLPPIKSIAPKQLEVCPIFSILRDLKDCQWRPHDELSVTAPIILEEFTAQFSKEPATTILNKRKRNTVQNQSS